MNLIVEVWIIDKNNNFVKEYMTVSSAATINEIFTQFKDRKIFKIEIKA